ncbi:DNA-deoxyinosine glycosylase [Halopseudomonas pelagia]|uniref:DNA-deoxyinosine glycosylase n=1 Tax=Halopseudomonas pelagia TaxID=553151 RepID=UPI0003B359E4|nr:DNA-deoxyinosine glycosylase [Halopseudomonas pelagia]|tara:strand:+ start:763 stop:1272 length:510 start_codon:yes stop_codon:yes gene_type:complete
MTRVHSFIPLARSDATCLVLGSMPGQASLAAQQYYAHPRNYFWPFMELIFEIPPGLAYEQRCEQLLDRRVAVWDVLSACTRSGSLDSDIIEASIIPNDLRGFLELHGQVRRLFFNGAKAESSFRRHVLPGLPDALRGRIHLQRLPSTSPANASVPMAVKLSAWQQLLDG